LEDRNVQHYVAVRTQVTPAQLPTVIPQLIGEVEGWLGKQGVSPAGAPFIRYHVIDMVNYLDIAVGWPVAAPLKGDKRITADVFPAGRYASLLYTGDYPGLYDANAALIDWAKQQGVVWDSYASDKGDGFGARFESYLTDPAAEPDRSKHQTLVAIRVAD
jgi:effector-binding domain-containing protein